MYVRELVLVDVSALMRTYFRPTYGKNPLYVTINDSILNTTHLYGLFNLFRTYGKEVDYVFTYDTKINFLKQDNPHYKQGRVKVDNEYYVGYELGKGILEKAGFMVLSKDGYEADHFIIQAHTELKKYYDKITVVTNDKDLAVVVDDKTQWVGTRKKQTPITLENYELELKVPYNGIHLKKALVGDPSDNLKGVVGLGEAKFKKFLAHEHITSETPIYGFEEDIIKQSTFLDDIGKSQALVDLKIIQPMEIPDTHIVFNEIDWDLVLEMLELLEMKTLIKYIQ